MNVTAYIGLGSNLGDRLTRLRQALAELSKQNVATIAVSSLYQTEPMYVTDQPAFLNTTAKVLVPSLITKIGDTKDIRGTELDSSKVLSRSTAAAADSFLKLLLEVERRLGRVRAQGETRFGPRIIDLDVLLWGEQGQFVVQSDHLTVPHPRVLERAFVLLPLAEICPDIVHPTTGRTIREHSVDLGSNGVDRLDGPGWLSSPRRGRGVTL